jgi:polar amino acid transport system substrate-binding protein
MKSAFLSLLGLVAWLLSASAASGEMLVEYRDKPPYSYTEDGKPRGFLIERTIRILEAAGIAATYQETPVKRIMNDIQTRTDTVICSPSWYKLPERESFARFSLAIHQDKPHLILAGPHAAGAVTAHKTLNDLFNDSKLRLGLIEGVSYGSDLDRMINQQGKNHTRWLNVTNEQLIKMIASARDADYMMMDDDDYNFLNKEGDLDKLGIVKVATKSNTPPGLKRYIMCSKSLDDATLARINQAIHKQLPITLNP